MVEKINIYTEPKEEVAEGIRCCVAFGQGMSFACFEKEEGNAAPGEGPFFAHAEEQATMIVEGKAIFSIEDQQLEMVPGDLVFVPPRIKHRLDVTEGPALFIFFYQPPMDARNEHLHLVKDD